MIDKPPSSQVNMDIGSTDIPIDDIKSERRVGKWDFLTKPILYPAGSAVCTRCSIVFMAL